MTTTQGLLLLCGLLAGLLVWVKIAPRPVRGIYLALFASGFLITPRLPVVRDKLSVCEIVMALTWLAMLFCHRSPSRLLSTQKSAVARGAAFLGITLVSFWANAAADNLVVARSSVETINYVYGFLLFATVVTLVESWDEWINCFYAWFCGTAVVSAVAVLTLMGKGPAWARDEFTGRISSTLKFSNQLPGYCIPVLMLLIVLAALRDTRPKVRWGAMVLAGGVVLSVVGSGSRMGLLMLVFSVAMVLAIGLWEARNQALSRRFLMTLGMAAAAGMAFFAVRVVSRANEAYALGKTPAYERAARMSAEWLQGRHETIDETRTDQLRLVCEKLQEQPVLGIGPANFTMAFHTNEVHNTYAGVLAEEGVFGLLALLYWLAGVIHNGRLGLALCPTGRHRLLVIAVLVGFTALLIYGLAMFGLRQRQFWMMAGLVAALPRVMQHLRAREGASPC